jgi:hypothetical protein
MSKSTRVLSALALATAALAAAPAMAQSTWNFAGFAQNTTNADNFGNSWSATQGGTKLTISAYSTSGTGGAIQTANIANYGTGSGFGVRNQSEGLGVSSPQHSMDNYTHTDMLALNFTNASTSAAVNMVLTQMMIGWHNTSTTTGLNCGGSQANCVDSDLSLLRWTGSGGPSITGGTLSSLLAAGWSLVNNYANLSDDVNRATGATNGSSWWLISAYNSAWGTGSNTANLSNGDDFMKVLSSVTTTPGTVSAPGTLALSALALLGLGVVRRRSAR